MAIFTPTTWNPADKAATVTLSNGNKTAVASGGSVRSTYGAAAGKWYWEYTISSGSTQMVGVATPASNLGYWPGQDALAWAYDKASGKIYNGGVVQTVASGGTNIGILLDATAKKLRFSRNGVLVGSEITLTGSVWHAIFGYGSTCVANFGESSFAYSVPDGYNPGLGGLVYEISGNVKDAAGANAARVVRVYRRDTGALVGSATSDAATGNYALTTEYEGEHTLVFLDDDAGTAYNALALDRVTGA